MSGVLNVFVVGLDRAPVSAVESLKKKLVAGMRPEIDLRFHVYVWIPRSGRLDNLRSGENFVIETPKTNAWCGLAKAKVTCVYQESPAAIFRQFEHHDAMVARGDIFRDEYSSIANYVAYLEFSKKASNHFSNLQQVDAPALLLRPDMLALDINLDGLFAFIDEMKNDVIYTPHWATFSYCNDRVAMGSTKAILQLMKRIDMISYWLKSTSMYFHPESFMSFSIKKAGVVNQHIPFKIEMARARVNGVVVYDDYRKPSIISIIKCRLWLLCKWSSFVFLRYFKLWFVRKN
jgi:hypothetical protein